MSGALPEERVPLAVVRQRWTHMTFLHWPYDPEVVGRFLPSGFAPDLHDGRAWVTLTPFLMEGFRVGFLPPVPRLSTFAETNLRTYVRGPGGDDGIWFFTLEAASLPLVLGARAAYGVPYRWAEMEVDRTGPSVRYLSRRRRDSGAGHRIEVRPGPVLAPDELTRLDHWLTGRWRAWTRVLGRPATVPVRHSPWPLHRVEVDELHETLVADAGLPSPEGPPLAHWSPGVDDVRLGPPTRRPVRRRRRTGAPSPRRTRG